VLAQSPPPPIPYASTASVAYLKNTSASSVYSDGYAAVRLNSPVRFQYSSNLTSYSTQCAYSSTTLSAFLGGGTETYPWFAVDLGAVYVLTDVQLWARYTWASRLSSTTLFVSQTPLVTAYQPVAKPLNASYACFSVAASSTATTLQGPCAATGRYLVLQNTADSTVLDFCAIQVFGTLLPTPPAPPPLPPLPPSPPPSPPPPLPSARAIACSQITNRWLLDAAHVVNGVVIDSVGSWNGTAYGTYSVASGAQMMPAVCGPPSLRWRC